jgi:thioredoxin-like negative regulator of GroEL
MIDNKTFDADEWALHVNKHDAILLYLFNHKCEVCNSLFPKVKELVERKFPKVKMVILDAEENRALAAQIRMLSVPGIIFYLDGKEQFRANGLIQMSELDRKIERPYKMMFD